ncbi:rplP [Symbiodinium natans]|uniref:RplP protein n=1 Tax=Symbiodinium natans TaxID=878477 RepID=A0A812RCK8_9DINO|nr:rplP [Symbiodinium natans]
MTARVAAAVALGSLGASAKEVFTDNPVCLQNNCINPVFPGLEDLYRLSNSTKWYCTTMEDTALSIGFCKGAVDYDIAVPEPQSAEEKSVAALVRKQDRAANTAYFTHLNGLGKDAWDYPNPKEADDCIQAIWKMVCYTYFPRAKAGCARGSETAYIRPCMSSCQNYVKACAVECCDESVQCVFHHTKPITKTTVLATSGYEPHDGPSTFCTGAAHRSCGPGVAMLLALMGFGSDFKHSSRVFVLALVLAPLAMLLQGCDAVGIHTVGNWRQQDDYLVTYQFVPPGASSREAVLNSCSLPGLSPTLQCSGHGGCHSWEKTSDSNPTPFCKCDPQWADPECRTKRKSQTTAYFLAVFLGVVGADRFYLELTLSAWLKLVLLGGLSIFWVTEVLITGSAPVNLSHDLRSWSGVCKVLVFFGLSSWYFIDIMRTGSAPTETSGFKTAPDFPRQVFVACTVFLAMLAGFFWAYWSVASDVAAKRRSLWLMQGTSEPSSRDSAKARSVYGSL